TFQNYFRKYGKLAGMTGTADTEAEEFAKIYKLDVVVIPPNRPLRRVENPDLVYRTEKEKWDAIVTEIIDEHKKGRPVLLGTATPSSWRASSASRSRLPSGCRRAKSASSRTSTSSTSSTSTRSTAFRRTPTRASSRISSASATRSTTRSSRSVATMCRPSTT